MAEVDLRDYLNEIDRLIERSSNDEAIQHCRHLFTQYPKCVEAYRLLGKALLEKEEDRAAQDVFERVLNVDPEDFVARVGLSIVHDRNNELDLAIWHMERAFDIAPSNELIQGELRRLYARRDGVAPERIALTRSALARIYTKGDLYDEAIADLRKMLEDQPNRIDLQVQLAEALWRNEQWLDAIDWTQRVTKQLPNCVKANLINGVVLRENGEIADSDAVFKRVQAVDPENIYAEALLGPEGSLTRQKVTVSRLEIRGKEELLEAALPVAETEEVPEWLHGITDLGAAEAPALAEAETYPILSTGVPIPEVAPAAEIPSWLQGLAESTEPAAEQKVPDWLASLAGGSVAAVAAETAEQEQAPAVTPTEEAVPDWLSQLSASAGPLGAAEPLAPASEREEETPDWLAQLQASEPPLTGEQPGEGETSDWLRALRTLTEEGPSLETGAMAGSVAAEPTTWWMQTGEDQGEEEIHLETLPPPESFGPEAFQPTEFESVSFGLPAVAIPEAETAPEAPEVIPSADDALAFLARLEAGKEDQLRAEAQAEAEARMSEIMGRKPAEAKPAEPLKAEAAPPQVPEAMPSADDALAFLARLAAGKEDQLRAEAQAEAEARMSEIMGRKPAEAKPGAPAQPEEKAAPVKMTVPAATVAAVAAKLAGKKEEPEPIEAQVEAPQVPEAMPSADDALAFLARLAAGKEDQLRAEAQAEAEARMSEIMGRKPAGAKPTTVVREEVTKEEPKPVEAQVEAPKVEAAPPQVPEAMPSADDALAFLARLAAGKEDQLRAEAQAEAEARMSEIMGRKPAAAKPAERLQAGARPPAAAGLAEQPVEEEALPEAELAPESESKDWLELLQTGEETTVVETTPESELPEWLRTMRPPEEAVAEAPEGELPEWLQAMRPTEESAGGPGLAESLPEEAPAAGEAEAIPEAELPDWLRSMRPAEELLTESELLEGEAPAEPTEEVAAISFGLVTGEAPAIEEKRAVEWWAQIAEDTGEDAYRLPTAQKVGHLSLDWWVQSAEDSGEEQLLQLPQLQELAVMEAEQPVPAAGKRPTQPLPPKTGPLAKSGPLPKKQTGPLGSAQAEDSINSLLARLQTHADDHDARLELARTYWATGRREDAFTTYTHLATTSAAAKEVMADLESIAEIQDQPDWHRLMGDVYMKAGRLTSALDHYRRALNEL